jgi:threonine dehydrogenase-like Zn-dependent dehydrogenase
MAEYITLRWYGTCVVPDMIAPAVCAEPLAAACRIRNRNDSKGDKVAILGDGEIQDS